MTTVMKKGTNTKMKYQQGQTRLSSQYANFPSTSPRGAYIWRDDLTEGFLRYEFGGLIFGGASTRRGLFSEFYGILISKKLFFRTMRTMRKQFPVNWLTSGRFSAPKRGGVNNEKNGCLKWRDQGTMWRVCTR